jgi:ferredoxin
MALSLRLEVNPISCTAHGLCAELLPELIQLDEWGYPILADTIPVDLEGHARRAVRACPTLALRITRAKARERPRKAT